jgi:hypothetical protein
MPRPAAVEAHQTCVVTVMASLSALSLPVEAAALSAAPTAPTAAMVAVSPGLPEE